VEVGYVGVEYGEVGHVAVRLYGDLADLAATGRPAPHHQVPVAAPRAVKDVIESLGVPHTEVDLVLVGGSSVAFAQRVIPGDRVSVYPQFADLDVATVSLVRPPPLPEPRFLLDVHLGALANRLRLLGLDAAYRNDAGDAELAATAAADERALLTRDRGLLMRANVVHGQLLRSHPSRQPGAGSRAPLRPVRRHGPVQPLPALRWVAGTGRQGCHRRSVAARHRSHLRHLHPLRRLPAGVLARRPPRPPGRLRRGDPRRRCIRPRG